MGFCLIKSRWIHQRKYSWDGPSRYVQPEKWKAVTSHVKMVGREFEFTVISLEDGILVSRSHSGGCSLCACSTTFLLQCTPSFLQRIISTQTWACRMDPCRRLSSENLARSFCLQIFFLSSG